ncbi:MAG: DNRLRE domain-containing protein [Deltaproteobacteria bacterium]|nr:DNRLRE domain-containing protein [Deltaproteobacteria bacterium]
MIVPRLRMSSGSRPLAMLLLGALLAPSAVEAGPGDCLPEPPAGQVYFCDPLEDGTSQHGTVVGGRFISSGDLADRGWQTVGFGDRIGFDIGTEVNAGRLSFWMRGVELSSTSLDNDNHHLVELFDRGGHGGSDPCTFLAGLRVFGLLSDPDWQGKAKFFLGSMSDLCPGEVNIRNFDPAEWQLDRWHHVEIEFGDGQGVFRFDGVQLGRTIEYGTCPIVLRTIYLPNNPWMENQIDSVDGAVYADVSFAGSAACTDPCDDGNFCTRDDVCQQGRCLGQPVQDGTPCDDGDPLTEDSVCRQGECVGDCSLPEDAVPVAEDQTVSVLWPDQVFPDDDTLDVELAQDGSIEAVSYLKFHIPSGTAVESARLHLFCDSLSAPQAAGGSGGGVHRVQDSSWQEGALTWSSRPAWDPVALDSLGSVERGQWYSLDVTAAASSGGALGLALVPNGPDGAHYLSREGGGASCLSAYLSLVRAAGDGASDGSGGDAGLDGGGRADGAGDGAVDPDGLDGAGDGGGGDGAAGDSDAAGGCGCQPLAGRPPFELAVLAVIFWLRRRA